MGLGRVCIIGNSHLIALKDGYSLANPKLASGVIPDFLFAPGSELDVQINNGTITPAAGRSRIALSDNESSPNWLTISDYDLFVIVGLGASPAHALRAHQSFRIFPWGEPGKRLVSRGVFEAIVSGSLRNAKAFEIAKQLRSNTDVPICVVTQPLPSAKVRTIVPANELQRVIHDRWKPMFDERLAEVLHSQFTSAAKEVASEIGCIFVQQPTETLKGSLTDEQYQVQNRVGFDGAGPANEVDDLSHMDREYGRLVLNAVANALDTRAVVDER